MDFSGDGFTPIYELLDRGDTVRNVLKRINDMMWQDPRCAPEKPSKKQKAKVVRALKYHAKMQNELKSIPQAPESQCKWYWHEWGEIGTPRGWGQPLVCAGFISSSTAENEKEENRQHPPTRKSATGETTKTTQETVKIIQNSITDKRTDCPPSSAALLETKSKTGVGPQIVRPTETHKPEISEQDVPGVANSAGEPDRRINDNRAFLLRCIKEGIPPNIASIWLHICSHSGKENFRFKSAGASTATTIDGEAVQKKNLARVLRDLLAISKNKQ